jgi:hypothetical protein
MQSIQINTGEIKLAINDDPNRVIVFNPADVMFAERFYKMAGTLEDTLTQYQRQMTELEKETGVDEKGIPVNADARMELVKEISTYCRGQIDELFGAGTSQKAFGDTLNVSVFAQFFEGITPFIKQARADKIQKYTNAHPRRK